MWAFLQLRPFELEVLNINIFRSFFSSSARIIFRSNKYLVNFSFYFFFFHPMYFSTRCKVTISIAERCMPTSLFAIFVFFVSHFFSIHRTFSFDLLPSTQHLLSPSNLCQGFFEIINNKQNEKKLMLGKYLRTAGHTPIYFDLKQKRKCCWKFEITKRCPKKWQRHTHIKMI